MSKGISLCKIHKENSIVHLQFIESAVLNHAHLQEIYEYINELYGYLPKLIDVRSEIIVNEKVDQYFNAETAKYKSANQALLIGKNTSQDVIDIFIGMNNERFPLNAFTDYESAINWLKSLEN